MGSFTRLISPLPDSELILKMIRELQQSYNLHTKKGKALAKRDFGNYLKDFEQELAYIEDVAEKARIKIVRMEESLKSVESSLKSFNRKLKKNKKNPTAKPAMQLLESFLTDIRKIRSKIKSEARRSGREERNIRRNI